LMLNEIREELLQLLKEDLMKEIKPKIEKEVKGKTEQQVFKPTEEKKEMPKMEGAFYKSLMSYFENNKIQVLKQEMIKKEKDFEFVVKVPSIIGEVMYFVKCKDKKRLTEVDVYGAYSEGKIKGLPTLLMSTGILNKKIEEGLDKKYRGQMLFMQMKKE